MHQSIPAAPIPPPGSCGAFAHPFSSGDRALANLARPGGWAFAYPGATLGVLTHSWFPTPPKSKHGGFYRKGPAIRSRLDRPSWTGQTSGIFLDFMHFFIELSLYIARLKTINVNRRTHASLIKDLNKI